MLNIFLLFFFFCTVKVTTRRLFVNLTNETSNKGEWRYLSKKCIHIIMQQPFGIELA